MMQLLREIVNDQETQILVDSALLRDDVELIVEAKVTKKLNDTKQLKHLHHAEDLPITDKQEGFHDVVDALNKTHEHLQGKSPSNYGLQTKFDGSPSVVFGHHPATKKFFVATKGAFAKNPKLNFNDEDVEKHHGKSPGLAKKLKLLLKHLKGSVPKEGVYQGDMMYSGEDVNRSGDDLNFTPNTLTYNVKRDSDEGRKIMKSKAGIAAHTTYEMDKNGEMNANFNIDMSKFNKDGDVHFLSTKLRGPHNYTGAEQKKYGEAVKKAMAAHKDFDEMEGHTAIEDHRPTLLAYINQTVRTGQKKSLEGYVSYLKGQTSKKLGELKTEKATQRVKQQLDDEIKNLTSNKKIYEKLFQLHGHLGDAKDTLVNALSKSSPYNETIMGEKSKPEGFVASHKGRPIKLVDRKAFSAANFEWNQKVNPEDKPTVMSFGRMNPPTVGHGKMIEKGADVARRIGAEHKVIASRSQDPKKNPLTPSQKLQWLKSMFPGKNLAIAGEGEHTLIAQIANLHKSGVKHLSIVAGSDRAKEFQDILAKYNGEGEGKLWNFKSARVISSGERDPDAEGVEGMSASKMRKAAADNDLKTFNTGMPKHLKPHEKEAMMHDLRAQMGVVKIDSMTNGHALSIYSKRTDKLGKDAIAEIARRKRHGIWKGDK